MSDWLDTVLWNADGLVPAIAQEASGTVLTLAWMNREALARTAATGLAHYWSRSRRRLWQKGESSGHVQRVREIRLDCDNDAILLIVEQTGGIACHTGRHRCFSSGSTTAPGTRSSPSSRIRKSSMARHDDILQRIATTIGEHRNVDPVKSYVATLFRQR